MIWWEVVHLRLRDLREDSDLTQKEVSGMLNIAQNTYSQYENGARQIPLETLSALADFYSTSVDYILERTDERRPYPKRRNMK